MNIGIIGFGKQGRVRFNAIKAINKNFKVIAICDIRKPAEIDFSEIKFTIDYNEVINNKDIDIVFICTPNYLSKRVVVAALDSGKHVFCEKPPGINLPEIEEMMAAEKRNPEQKLMFGFNHRHHESMIRAKEVIDSGELGKVLWMRGRYGNRVDEGFYSTWRAKKELAGGGVFLNQGIYMLDLFLMMIDGFDEVKSYVSNLYWKSGIEDNVFAMFKNNRTGQVASLHSTMTQWRHLFSFEIFLEEGHIIINGLLTPSGAYGEEQLTIAKNSGPTPAAAWDVETEEKKTYDVNNSWESEIKMFFDAIENNHNIDAGNTQDAYKLMKLVDEVYQQK